MLLTDFLVFNLCAIHAKRVTIMPKDMLLIRALNVHLGLEPFDPAKKAQAAAVTMAAVTT